MYKPNKKSVQKKMALAIAGWGFKPRLSSKELILGGLIIGSVITLLFVVLFTILFSVSNLVFIVMGKEPVVDFYLYPIISWERIVTILLSFSIVFFFCENTTTYLCTTKEKRKIQIKRAFLYLFVSVWISVVFSDPDSKLTTLTSFHNFLGFVSLTPISALVVLLFGVGIVRPLGWIVKLITKIVIKISYGVPLDSLPSFLAEFANKKSKFNWAYDLLKKIGVRLREREYYLKVGGAK